MITVEVNGKTARVPSSWDEMSPRQVRETFRIFDRCVRKGLSPLDFNVRELYMLLGVRKTLRGLFQDIAGNEAFRRRSENVYLLCERLLGFLFSGDDATLSYDSFTNPMPVAWSGLRRLHGPTDLLQDLTFGEFRHASAAVNKFFETKDVADLDETVAFLYRTRCRRANRAGRKVPEISNRNVSRHIQRAKKVKTWRKNLIMMWFSNCLKYLQNGVVELNGEPVELSALFSKDDKTTGVAFGWSDMLVELAKENTIGNIDRVDEEPLFSVLSIMWHNYKERKRDEQIAKASKAH
jgi:hypothetical protein